MNKIFHFSVFSFAFL